MGVTSQQYQPHGRKFQLTSAVALSSSSAFPSRLRRRRATRKAQEHLLRGRSSSRSSTDLLVLDAFSRGRTPTTTTTDDDAMLRHGGRSADDDHTKWRQLMSASIAVFLGTVFFSTLGV